MLPGVYKAKKKDGSNYYRSSITYANKHISLGSFSSEKAAHLAYLEAGRILSDQSVSLNSYPESCLLSFEKWVSIINFRDNLLYIKTPVYLKNNYFHYYFSPHEFYLFDIEDLFYYSRHKIMKRQGHLFVADYGMQVSILSRYGIKNYAVAGIDYEFINGNPYDFRYENLRVLNPYYGVKRIQKNGSLLYQTAIHIKSNYIVGYYKKEIEAAIAYNKAVDVLLKKGLQKKYTYNYIEQLSPSSYADIYASVRLSDKIYELDFSSS